MDVCHRFFGWRRGKDHHHYTKEELSMNDENINNEGPFDDDEHYYPEVGKEEKDEERPVFYHTTEFENAQSAIGVNTDEEPSIQEDTRESEEVPEEAPEQDPLHSIGETMLVDSLIKSLQGDHAVAAVYNYILTEAAVISPGIVPLVINKIDELLPALRNAEEGFLLSLKNVGIEAGENRTKNPFYELKRKYYALKYLLEGHTQ